MTDSNFFLLVAGLLAVCIYALFTIRLRGPRRLPYPPGPKRLPLIGNLLQLPSNYLWESAVEWEKEYGDVIYLESLGRRMLVVNSYESATELLTRRSAIYSSRPHLTMAVDLEGWDWVTVFVPYGNAMRAHRSYQQRFFDSQDRTSFLDVQLSKTHEMLKGILDDPKNYGNYVKSLPGSVILRNVYGYQTSKKDDPYVRLGKLGAQYASDSEHYFFLDILPWLKYLPEWFPFAKFHSEAKKGREVANATKYDLYERAKRLYEEGTLEECMTSVVLSENRCSDGSIADEENFMGAAGTLYLGSSQSMKLLLNVLPQIRPGGVDTSGTALMTFVMLMLKHPEVQKRGQAEVDAVVGTDRLPGFEDADRLPFVRAICDEVLRFASVITLVAAHYTHDEDEFKGYRTPANCIVFANAWAMAFNPKYFPEPHVFKPERWLSGGVNCHRGPRPRDFAFGFGRRLCPGRLWAENLLFIAVSSMLATFNFEKAIGDDGKPVEPNDKYHPSFIRRLEPSICKIAPRTKKVASLIELAIEK